MAHAMPFQHVTEHTVTKNIKIFNFFTKPHPTSYLLVSLNTLVNYYILMSLNALVICIY